MGTIPFANRLFKTAKAFLFSALLPAAVAHADVIYQAHNMRFVDIEKQLPDLKDRHITHVQISPIHKSNPSPAWWARYQPVDHSVIDGPLGDEAGLKRLIEASHQAGIKVIVDVVFNHMANIDNLPCTLRYPQFSAADFHGDCYNRKSDRADARVGWLGGDLPDLKTESAAVRQVAKATLNKLMDMGVDGFRYDAAGHIEPDFFAAMNSIIKPRGRFAYGEVLVHYNRINYAWDYTPVMSVTDYPLLARMSDAFSFGADIRMLRFPSFENKALPGTSAVTFANNHDVYEHPWDFGGMALDGNERDGRPSDQVLANAYILGRQEGFPMVFRNDLYHQIVSAGIRFHEAMLQKRENMRDGDEYAPGLSNPSLLFIERGDAGLVIINKSNDWFNVVEPNMPGLAPGCYRDLVHNFVMQVALDAGNNRIVTRWGGQENGEMQIGPRDAFFFVKGQGASCLVP
jgi:alpha-amylase